LLSFCVINGNAFKRGLRICIRHLIRYAHVPGSAFRTLAKTYSSIRSGRNQFAQRAAFVRLMNDEKLHTVPDHCETNKLE